MGLICSTDSFSGLVAVGVCERGMVIFQITENVGADRGEWGYKKCGEESVRSLRAVVGDFRWQDYVRQETVKTKEGVRYEVEDRQGQSYTKLSCVIKRRFGET
jgi:hypothetical protein